jgi:hypothetical protein
MNPISLLFWRMNSLIKVNNIQGHKGLHTQSKIFLQSCKLTVNHMTLNCAAGSNVQF